MFLPPCASVGNVKGEVDPQFLFHYPPFVAQREEEESPNFFSLPSFCTSKGGGGITCCFYLRVLPLVARRGGRQCLFHYPLFVAPRGESKIFMSLPSVRCAKEGVKDFYVSTLRLLREGRRRNCLRGKGGGSSDFFPLLSQATYHCL